MNFSRGEKIISPMGWNLFVWSHNFGSYSPRKALK